MIEARLTQLYAGIMARRAATPGRCEVSPETMVELLEGRVTGVERRRLMLDILREPRCREEFELLRAVVESGPSARRRPATIARPLALAAALALLVGGGIVWRGVMRPGPEPVRNGEGGGVGLIAPPAEASTGLTPVFAWHPVPGALRFDYELVTRDGDLVYSTTLADTLLTLPGSVQLKAGVDYRWWVEAVLGTGERVRSPVRPLQIAAP